MSSEVITCNLCELEQRVSPLAPGQTAKCQRCASILKQNRSHSRGRTAALTLAALFLYGPANIYPIARMEYLGRYSESTVWDGVVKLSEDGMWFVAVVVFLASMLVPLLKLLGLLFLVLNLRTEVGQTLQTWVYRIISAIGPWAMLDVFLLAVLVALVKIGTVATVTPGPGILAYAGVVVLTLLASSTFDPRLIWQKENP